VASVLLDTHAWAWTITGDKRLSGPATAAMIAADTVTISPISVFEIGQKVRLGKWPEMAKFETEMPKLLDGQGVIVLPLTPEIALHASLLDWPHRDPFDRILAATALLTGRALISVDAMFDTLPGLRRIWD
jgi:PIN domain nuclease of toxin-antitoxin system